MGGGVRNERSLLEGGTQRSNILFGANLLRYIISRGHNATCLPSFNFQVSTSRKSVSPLQVKYISFIIM
jgi:hypothetical protein